MQTTQLIIIRHGETQANVDGRMQGRGDDPLTARGRRQVEQIARRLAAEKPLPAAIYSSSLPRARATAEVIAQSLGLEPIMLDDLQEMHIGDLENATAEELETVQRSFTSLDDRYPGGESIREFIDRIMGAFGRIVAIHRGQRVVAVSHGGVISTALAIWSGRWQPLARIYCQQLLL
ncbi:MAG: hypothetical protein KatS3mg057_1889 [Herpetosiphonaceae bacterium]|nr:MAG: hypothetical protein KatS3mg057_1889 [Herpetosiphonaceae bacterium]